MYKVLKISVRVCALLAIALVVCVTGFAQSTRGELAGSVTDPTGAVIPNAQIEATNVATGEKNATVSTSAGTYRFTDIAIGSYNLMVTAPGFSVANNTGVQVTVNSTTSLNVTLKTGQVTETVNVDASGARIETESSDLGGTISDRQITELPLAIQGGVNALRSPENFVFLVPGTTGPGAGGSQGLNGNGVFFGKISGGQSYGAEVLLDGASVTRSENGSSFDETSPSVEALQEFKVTTSTPSSEFGRTTSGIESFVTKNGTNAFHGTAFEIYKNKDLNANGWFETAARKACAPGDNVCRHNYDTQQDTRNNYGGSLGGPVFIPHLYNGHDKSFFFFAWEQFREKDSATTQATVPTVAERSGDFSALLGGVTNVINPCTGQPVIQNQIFDPNTTNTTVSATNPSGTPCRLPFANNMIPTGELSKAGQALVAALPNPNQTATNTLYGFYNNYVNTTSFPQLNTTMTIRIDQSISDKSKIFASYSSRDNGRQGANDLPLPFSNFNPQDFFTHYSRAGWDYTISPHLLNHLNAGYNRTNSKNFAQTLGGKNYAQEAGIANIVSTAFPVINFDGLDSLSSYGNGSSLDAVDNGSRIADSISYQLGRHSMKFGVDLRYQQYSVINSSIPTFYFERGETDVARLSNTPQFQSGNSFASLLLGVPDSTFQTSYIHLPRWNSKYFGVFFEDDVKVSSNLTLNLGLRYDIDFPRHEAENDTSNFSLTAPDPHANNLPGALIFSKTCHCNSAWADTYYKDIAPRIGFAYVLPNTNGKAVLRGGGAMIYGPLLYDDFGGSMVTGYSVPVSATSSDAFTPAYQLDAGFPHPFPNAPNLDPGQLDTGSFAPVGGTFISPNMGRPSVTYNESLQIQGEVAQDLIVTLGYIGQEAQNLRSALQNINNIPISDFSYGNHLDQDFISAGHPADGISAPYPTFNGQLFRALRPLPQYDYIATDCCLQNVGHSSYNALVASVNRRFRNGFNFTASYTWQKNLTDADSALANNNPGGLAQDQDIYNHRLEKAVSYLNIPHTFVTSYLYELPFGKNKRFLNSNGLANFFVGGWQIGGIQRYQSGQAISFGCATGIPGYQNCIRFSRGPAPLANPAYLSNKHGAANSNPAGTGVSWFGKIYDPTGTLPHGTTDINQAAFIDKNDTSEGFRPPDGCTTPGCSYAPFTLGTGIPRVTEEVTSPLWLSEDFSLIKNFPIKEGVSFQFKAEAIDAFNRHNFTLPDINPRDQNFGVSTIGSQNLGPRNLQVTGRINF